VRSSAINTRKKKNYLKVAIFGEVPWHIFWVLPDGVVFIQVKWSTDVEVTIAVAVSGNAEIGAASTCPSKPIKSAIVPRVKSAIMYISRA
jgi:hypothetical protein